MSVYICLMLCWRAIYPICQGDIFIEGGGSKSIESSEICLKLMCHKCVSVSLMFNVEGTLSQLKVQKCVES